MISIKTDLPGPKARTYLEASKRYEPRSMSEQVPVVWARAQGCYVEDIDGNVFLDMTSGVLVANAGHSHPKLVAEMRAQADRVVNCYDFVNEWRPLLAQKLVEITPHNLDRAFIITTGAEAVDASIKLARKFTGRKEILAFHGAFHGRTYGGMSVGGKRSGAGTAGFGPFLPGVLFAPFPYCYRCAFGQEYDQCELHCLKYLDTVMDAESEGDLAAVLVETYQGAAGSIIPPHDWMTGLADWCRKREALLIVDEVQASFGRTGKLFGFEHYGLQPNMVCLGKGISSGLPVSALMAESRITDKLSPGSLSSTHGGNAFCSRVALKNIDVIMEERMVENSARVGAAMLGRFKEMEQRYPCVGEARGMGLALALEMVSDRKTKQPAPKAARAIVEYCYQHGLLMIAPIGMWGQVIRVAPPLVITEAEAMEACDIIEGAIRKVAVH